MRNWDSVSRVFVLAKSHPPRAFPLLEDSEFFSDVVSACYSARSCIASLKVLNYDLEDRLKKVYDCVRFIQTIPMVWASIAHSRCPRSIILQTQNTNGKKVTHKSFSRALYKHTILKAKNQHDF